VPFRNRLVLGVVDTVVAKTTIKNKLQTISQILTYAALTKTQQWLRKELVNYYGATETTALTTLLPDLARRPEMHAVAAVKKITSITRQKKPLLPLSQSAILTGVLPNPTDDLYVARTKSAIRLDQQSLILLPDSEELFQVTAAYKKFCRAELWHGSLSRTESARIYRSVARGDVEVIVGTRSALFLPFVNLGNIMVHYPTADGHRSWDMQPHYDATVLASTMASALKIPILVSSTVAPTTLLNALPVAHQTEKQRRIIIADRRAVHSKERQHPLDSNLVGHITPSTLVLVPRRGYAAPLCRDCEFMPRCPVCDHRLSYADASQKMLRCPLCSQATPAPALCPECKGSDFRMVGTGVERVMNWLTKQLPETKITQLTAETLSTASKNIPSQLTVATPFIVPHLYALPRFQTIIALRADSYLAAPNWFSNEATYHLLATLGAATSESLIIDTAEPQHPVYQALAHSDPKILYDAERDDRKRFLYPPFGEVVSITLRTASPEIGTRLKEILPRATYTVSQKNIIIHAPKGTNFSAIWSVLPDDAIVDHNAPTLL